MTAVAEAPVLKSADKKFDLSALLPGIKVEKPRPASSKWSMILYGGKGAGKTTLCGSASEVEALGPVLHLATEDGSSVLARDYGDDPNLDVINISDWPTAAKVIQTVSGYGYDAEKKAGGFSAEPPTPYRTVVVDTVSELQELMKFHTTNGGKQGMEYKDWGFIADKTIDVIKMLHRSPHVNVIFTTHIEKVKDDESGRVMTSPYFLGKKSLGEALKPVDIVAYLAVVEDKGERKRVLQTGTNGKIDASDRFGKLQYQIVNPSFAEIYAQLTAA